MIEFLSSNQAEIIGIVIFIIAGLFAAVLTGKLGGRNNSRRNNQGTPRAHKSSLDVRQRIDTDL